MQNQVPFCTCRDTACPNNPVNHDKGCTLCILKNLECGEIPTCFFKKVEGDYRGPGYSMRDFAELVMKQSLQTDA